MTSKKEFGRAYFMGIIFLCNVGPGFSTSLPSEEEAIQKLRGLVSEEALYEDYMKQDDFLLPWLKAKDMRPEEASIMLTKALRWRLENGIDAIELDESLQCARNYPSEVSIIDKSGRPVWLLKLRDWDVRRAALAGRVPEFVRCCIRYIEIMLSRGRAIRSQQATLNSGTERNETGQNQFVFVADLKGSNLRQHGCAACVSGYISALRAYEEFYPDVVHSLYIINTPRIFDTILRAAKSVMSRNTRDRLHVFSFDDMAWQTELLKVIDTRQLPSKYGLKKNARNNP